MFSLALRKVGSSARTNERDDAACRSAGSATGDIKAGIRALGRTAREWRSDLSFMDDSGLVIIETSPPVGIFVGDACSTEVPRGRGAIENGCRPNLLIILILLMINRQRGKRRLEQALENPPVKAQTARPVKTGRAVAQQNA